ncbi:S-adenosyl-L-methionine-dependent methyltransferase [Gilbertella persicaria]|uniref:S-adenosyl-L-methionine-dependent methyltransferase n=1 Tax=Gilbertella persicaria TaxID=101096 RepID=UPI00221ED971|nr:S-adenosyl-L-methionine-dependent methyltransferase [Gilbertella persicaria]KAI8088087.1 S-adenosyl-L-methionine-dependent methyltransferase [Gilbertella persicaria]
MAFFSSFRLLFSKKDKRSSTATIESSSKSRKNTQLLCNQSHARNYSLTGSTHSVNQTSSTGTNFQFKDGRRYHGDTDIAYLLPTDDDEADRVHQQHWILRYALQCNYQAPVSAWLEKGISVLDAGCGPATWTFEMGEQYPNSKIYGVDAACVFPENIKPANVEFAIGNIANKIPFPDNTFDYIHQRLLVFGMTNEDWENALKELYRVLKPGGYVELAEPDLQNLHCVGPLLQKLQQQMSAMLESRNMPPRIASELEDRLTKAGFVNQVLNVTPLKLNHTDKAGVLLWDDYKHAYTNVRPAVAAITPEWEDPEEFERYIDACGKEATQQKTCINWFACYAQKPHEE